LRERKRLDRVTWSREENKNRNKKKKVSGTKKEGEKDQIIAGLFVMPSRSLEGAAPANGKKKRGILREQEGEGWSCSVGMISRGTMQQRKKKRKNANAVRHQHGPLAGCSHGPDGVIKKKNWERFMTLISWLFRSYERGEVVCRGRYKAEVEKRSITTEALQARREKETAEYDKGSRTIAVIKEKKRGRIK